MKRIPILLAVVIVFVSTILPMSLVPATQQSTSNDLGVVPIQQRKDTYLLCLGTEFEGVPPYPPYWIEGCDLTGPCAWDIPHLSICEHGSKHCVPACISMTAEFFGGNLPQDRISIYIHEEREGPDKDGQPENDLGHMVSCTDSETIDALSWGLNGATITYIQSKPTFSEIVQWIDEGRPVMIRIKFDHTGHAELIVGYNTSGEKVNVINPTYGTKTTVSYDSLNIDKVWIPPSDAEGRIAEPSIFVDTDEDGVYDYDEEERFKTNKNKKDTDDDGIEDKIEIRSYTFLSNDTFDTFDIREPDSDHDGKRAELDPDSDNGGVIDGLEDLNHNGKVDAGETDPFDPTDDPSLGTDIAIINITPSEEYPVINETLTISVELENQGITTETFDLSLNYTRIFDPLIGTQTITLNPGQTLTVNFTWVPEIASRYEIKAYTSYIANDIDPSDNTRTKSFYVASRRYDTSTYRSSGGYSYDSDDTLYLGHGRWNILPGN